MSPFHFHRVPSSGERMGRGPSYEVYRNTPMDTAAAKLETELYLPLADAG